jgi:hypothetical protein
VDILPSCIETKQEESRELTYESVYEPCTKHDRRYDEWKLERDHHLWEFGSIYKIVNDQDNLIYIGSTVGTILKRLAQHKKDALTGSSWALHFHMRALGLEHFSIHLIDTVQWVTIDELHVVESKHMTIHRSVIAGLNSQYASRMCYHGHILKRCKDCNIGIACGHYFNRCMCFDCKYTENTLDICCHNKMRACCHYCNRCKWCDAISTKEHVMTKDHIQNKIRADALVAQRKFISEQNTLQNETLERIDFTYVQLRILDKRKDIRLGKVKLRKLNRKQVNLIRSA